MSEKSRNLSDRNRKGSDKGKKAKMNVKVKNQIKERAKDLLGLKQKIGTRKKSWDEIPECSKILKK